MPATKSIKLQIHLPETTPGALGGVQVGARKDAKVINWVQTDGSAVTFETEVEAKNGSLPLKGSSVNKDSKGRFIYVVWRSRDGVISRRAKFYIESITQELVDRATVIRAVFPGLAKDGLPCCATVKPIEDWHSA